MLNFKINLLIMVLQIMLVYMKQPIHKLILFISILFHNSSIVVILIIIF